MTARILHAQFAFFLLFGAFSGTAVCQAIRYHEQAARIEMIISMPIAALTELDTTKLNIGG